MNNPKIGDIYRHRSTGLLCLILADKPHTTCGAWRVKFLTGNRYMTAGFVTPIELSTDAYEKLETK